MAIVIDNPEDIMELLERSMSLLSVEGRSIWTSHDIDPVVDNLLEVWQLFKIECN